MELLAGTDNNDVFSEYWKTASEKWVETIQLMCTNFDFTDAPWEHLEKTNSAIFAGALSVAGLPALPEAKVMRNGGKGGHVDVYAVGVNIAELIEFKSAEYNPQNRQTIKQIDSMMNYALLDVKNIFGLNGKEIDAVSTPINRIGAVIGLPYFDPGTSEIIIKEGIQKIIADLRATSYPIKAWVFPPEYVTRPSNRYMNRYYPGTFLVAQKA